MPPQPALGDRAGQSGAVLVRRGASFEERAVDQLDIDATILNRPDTVGDLDPATSGSVNWLGSTNFMGSLLSISKNFDVSKLHGKTGGSSQTCIDVWSD